MTCRTSVACDFSPSLSRDSPELPSRRVRSHTRTHAERNSVPASDESAVPSEDPRARPRRGMSWNYNDVRAVSFSSRCGEDRIVEAPSSGGNREHGSDAASRCALLVGKRTKSFEGSRPIYRPILSQYRTTPAWYSTFRSETGPLLALWCRKSEKEFLPHFLRRGVGDANGITGPVQNFNFGIKFNCFEPKSNPKLTEILRGKKEKMTPGPMGRDQCHADAMLP